MKATGYQGKEVMAPLYQREVKEFRQMNDRYNPRRAEELTLRQEMDLLAEKNKRAELSRYW